MERLQSQSPESDIKQVCKTHIHSMYYIVQKLKIIFQEIENYNSRKSKKKESKDRWDRSLDFRDGLDSGKRRHVITIRKGSHEERPDIHYRNLLQNK